MVRCQFSDGSNIRGEVYFGALHRDGLPYYAYYVPPDSIYFLTNGGITSIVNSCGLNLFLVDNTREIEIADGKYSVSNNYIIQSQSDTIVSSNPTFLENYKFLFFIYNNEIYAFNSTGNNLPLKTIK